MHSLSSVSVKRGKLNPCRVRGTEDGERDGCRTDTREMRGSEGERRDTFDSVSLNLCNKAVKALNPVIVEEACNYSMLTRYYMLAFDFGYDESCYGEGELSQCLIGDIIPFWFV